MKKTPAIFKDRSLEPATNYRVGRRSSRSLGLIALLLILAMRATKPAENPVLIGVLPPPVRITQMWDVAVQGQYAYVAFEGAGILIVDVSDPAAPKVTSRFATGGNAQAVALNNGHLYVAANVPGLQILDVSNPAQALRIGTYKNGTGEFAWDVAFSGNYAYIAYGPSVEVIDVRDPAAPVKVDSYATIDAIGIAVVGNYAYVVQPMQGLTILDITNPANITRVGSIDTSGFAMKVAVEGDYAYIADYSPGLQIIRISDPTRPVRVGGYNTSGDTQSLALSGPRAYTADRNGGIHVIDLSNPAAPKQVGSYRNSSAANYWALGVTVVGDYLYVANSEEIGFEILKLPSSNPALSIRRSDADVIVSWPGSATGFQLETVSTIPNMAWSAVTNSVTTLGQVSVITNELSFTPSFFRLRKP